MSYRLPQVDPAPRKARRPRGRGWIAGVVAGVAAVVLVGVLGVRAVLVRALCEQGPVRLHISAAQDIAPAVMRIGQHFNDLGRDVGGRCAQVEVTEDPASAVAAQLSGTGAIRGEGPVDAWVPDSSLWPDVVGSSPRGAAAVHWTGISVARSPLVIAAPPQVAGALMKWSRHIGWPALFPVSLGGPSPSLGLQIQFPDPAQSAVGLATIVEVRRLLGGRQAARARFTAFAHNVQPTTALQDPQDLAAFTALSLPPWNGRPVTVTSEQAVEAYNQSNPRVRLAAFYPAREYDLNYPFVVTTSAPLKLQAAQQFEQVLRSSLAAAYVRDDGFRSPGGGTDQARPGIVGNLQPAVGLAAPGEVDTAMQAWHRLSLGSRQLVLDDVSGAMAQPLQPGGDSRMRVIQGAARLGLSLAPNSTEIAVWEYSYRLAGSLPYRLLVPMGPLPEQLGLLTRRQQLQELSQTLTAQPGASAAMYSAILGGFAWMTAHYQPGYVNALLVLGSGTETAPNDISLGEMLTRLRRTYDPQRPVEIIIISAGADADQTALQQIAAISHGQAYVVQQPSDMLRVFFDAVGRRLCNPNCG